MYAKDYDGVYAKSLNWSFAQWKLIFNANDSASRYMLTIQCKQSCLCSLYGKSSEQFQPVTMLS